MAQQAQSTFSHIFTTLGAATTALALMVATAGTTRGVLAQSATAAPTAAATQAGPTPTAYPLSGDPVYIGIAVAQSSNTALLGSDEVDGAKLAQDYFNYRGGINGRPIQLVFQDTAGDPQGAIDAFQKLIGDDRIVGIVGPTLSTQALAADPISNRAGVPVIAPSNTAAGIPQIGPFVSRVSAGVAAYAPGAVTKALTLNPGAKTAVVFFAQDDAFSKSETGVFQQAVKDKGLNLALVQPFSLNDRDFTAQISAAMAVSPDLIIVSGLTADGGNLVKQLRDIGYKGIIIGGNGLNTKNIYPVCQAECDGLLIAQAYSPLYNGNTNNEFVAAYKLAKNTDAPPGQLVAQAFTGVQVFVTALRNVDTKSKLSGLKIADLRVALNTEIQAGKYDDTPIGPISFTVVKAKDGSQAGGELNQTVFGVAQIKMDADGKNGKFTMLP